VSAGLLASLATDQRNHPNQPTNQPTNQQHAANRPGGVFTIGATGRCLSKALAEGKPLVAACRALVLAAAPKDARAYLQYPETTTGAMAVFSDVQRAAGLEGVLVDPYTRGGATVTVTGWLAFACIVSFIVVGFGSMVIVYRRVAGVDKPHTQYVKSGDA
jgi:Golgi apparatus protein 1